MNVVNSSGMSADFAVPRDKHGFEHVVVVVKGAFTVRADGRVTRAEVQVPLTIADVPFGEPGTTSLKSECDFVLFKPKTDILLFGSAYAPRGGQAKFVDATMEMGPVRKTIRVFGDRVWEAVLLRGVLPGEPKPFAKRELRYEFAYGGVDRSDPDVRKHAVEERNLVGCGFASRADLRGQPVPNQEHPDHLLGMHTKRPTPMSFGIVSRNWLPRRKYAGTYDQKWLDTKFPFLPDDFDNRYNQSAAEDQQCNHLSGGEPVRLTNLTPEGRLEFVLPREEFRVALHYGMGKPETEIRPVLDTVILEPDVRRVVLVWRGSVRLRQKLTSIRQVRIGELSPGRVTAEQTGKRYVSLGGGS